MTITAPAMTPTQAEAWHALFEVYKAHPKGWALVGGQMVHSLCWEREADPPRPTQDADAILDIRAHPTMLFDFTKTLTDLGYKSAGESPSILEGMKGVQHRWVKGAAQIDVLIPRFLGERADNRTGVTGGRTIAAPGGQGALDRSEVIEVAVAGVTGTVRRPTLQGAITAKASAMLIGEGTKQERHLNDLSILASLVTRGDRVGENVTSKEAGRVRVAFKRILARPSLHLSVGVDAEAIKIVLEQFVLE
ncbi:hypothetical protein C5E07_00635 [Pseudoclavibacter sp. RFBJ3]|uniref:hypothetical protein n=1 Tax=unclassified Pseudoclavibacter TaxID=2615177 RepID=UPI000CE81431|nr:MULTISPECIES: hypothetical protein [unclassified Pseudoclavibacter]PPF86485.1 hypothetical protein C5C12_01845 [Pseudoclavibacter sp. RFBJ5]PPF95217.1 hypothetical protein C5E07_00635 [Pseudoclavibacter sp. RFBJ3]PPF97651.1 hypothetical protein C5C19_11315 [Pseudoclavibacter sp. RFBH5]PPG22695.1 hypothetical protein C5E13_10625 [Pseudoclavibacter sp. RFBI4]